MHLEAEANQGLLSQPLLERCAALNAKPGTIDELSNMLQSNINFNELLIIFKMQESHFLELEDCHRTVHKNVEVARRILNTISADFDEFEVIL